MTEESLKAQAITEKDNTILEQRLREKYKYVNRYNDVVVVENKDYKWGVVTLTDEIIVPFGKYGWIDRFDSGLARVRCQRQDREVHPEKKAKWGIINERGEEVLPLEYDNIWNWVGKNRYSTKVEKGNERWDVYFCDLNPMLPDRRRWRERDVMMDDSDCWSSRDNDYLEDSWYAMTDGQYGDMPEGFNGDYDFLGY